MYLGNLDARRDWGFAKDYVEAMGLILQQKVPSDHVIASGEWYSVREFVELVFANLEIEWVGEGLDGYGVDKSTGNIVIRIDSKFFRPNDVNLLIGDPSKARKELGWKPKTKFNEFVKIMVDFDYELMKKSILND